MEQLPSSQTSSFRERSLGLIIRNKSKIHSYLNKAIGVSLLAVSLLYIGTVNDLSIKGFVLQELRGQAMSLESENENRELAVMGLESYDKIEKRAKKLGMVKVDELKYVSRVDGSVAVR
jgi:cell division protein FtsL